VSEVAALLSLLEGHHITDRALVRARDRAQQTGDASALEREIQRYFSAVERESGALLASVDRRLEELYQRQYNLEAERGVAERRSRPSGVSWNTPAGWP
jgi:hypothetical protein